MTGSYRGVTGVSKGGWLIVSYDN